MEEKLKNLDSLSILAMQGGGQQRIEYQHNKGKLTARERLALCWMIPPLKKSECLSPIGIQILIWIKIFIMGMG